MSFFRRAATAALLALPALVVRGGEAAQPPSPAPAPAPLSDPAAGAKPCAIEALARPYVLMTQSRVERLRGEIARPGMKADAYTTSIRANAQRWRVREIWIPERAGHFHNFVCTDGVRLEVPANQDFGDARSYGCPACGKRYEGEKFDGARRNYEHVWLMSAACDLALTWAMEGRREDAAKAAEILRKYADAYPGRHTAPTAGGIFYQSLDESMYIIPLAQAYDLIYDSGILSDADKAHIERDLFWESAAGLIACGARTNWGSWHLSAVGVIGLATKHQRLIDYGTEKFQAQIRDELGDDGLWPESVHTYHFFPLRAFVAFAEASTNAGTDLWNWEAKPGKGLRAMFTAPLRYMYPDFRLPAINDGWFDSWLPGDQYEAAYSRFKDDPELAWAVAERRKGDGASAGAAIKEQLWTFVAGEELPAEIAKPALASTNFPVLGICTLRTGGATPHETMMTFDYGRMLGHGQLDVMGITLHAGGRLIAADYGTPSYGTDVLPFYKGTTSHNTIAADGKNQAATKRADLWAFEDAPLAKIAAARTDEALPGARWSRTVVLTDDYALVVDDVKATQSRVWDWLLHAEGDGLQVEGAARRDGAATLPHPYLKDVVAFDVRGTSYTARWTAKSGPGLTLAGACGPGTELYTARCPAETAVRTVPILVQRATGPEARFATLLLFAQEPAATPAAPQVIVREDGAVWVERDGLRDILQIGAGTVDLRRQLSECVFENVTAGPLQPAEGVTAAPGAGS